MTRFLLDTNIVSDPLKPRPSAAIARWFEGQAGADLFIAALTLGELRRGILQRAPGRRREALESWFAGPSGPQGLFHDRILPFDVAAAIEWARIMAEGTALGRPRGALDMIIAAIAAANECVVVTTNDRHFRGAAEFLTRPAARDEPRPVSLST